MKTFQKLCIDFLLKCPIYFLPSWQHDKESAEIPNEGGSVMTTFQKFMFEWAAKLSRVKGGQ